MTCILEVTPEGYQGVVKCSEKGCEFRRTALGDAWTKEGDVQLAECVELLPQVFFEIHIYSDVLNERSLR